MVALSVMSGARTLESGAPSSYGFVASAKINHERMSRPNEQLVSRGERPDLSVSPRVRVGPQALLYGDGALLQRVMVDAQKITKEGFSLVLNVASLFDVIEHLNEGSPVRGPTNESGSLDDELRNGVNSHFRESSEGVIDFCSSFLAIEKVENRFFRRRMRLVGVVRENLFDFFGRDIRKSRSVVERVTINEIIHVESVVQSLAHVQTVVLPHELNQSMARHRVPRESVQIKVGYSCRSSSSFEIVPSLLFLPASLASPLLDQTLTVSTHRRHVFGIIVLQKEGNAKNRKSELVSALGRRSLRDVVDGPSQLLLPNVPVGSQRV